MKFDDKELNVLVNFDELINHIRIHCKAVVYLKTGNEFETVILYSNENWSLDLTKKYISEGRLFRRRNKPFESMMA